MISEDIFLVDRNYRAGDDLYVLLVEPEDNQVCTVLSRHQEFDFCRTLKSFPLRGSHFYDSEIWAFAHCVQNEKTGGGDFVARAADIFSAYSRVKDRLHRTEKPDQLIFLEVLSQDNRNRTPADVLDECTARAWNIPANCAFFFRERCADAIAEWIWDSVLGENRYDRYRNACGLACDLFAEFHYFNTFEICPRIKDLFLKKTMRGSALEGDRNCRMKFLDERYPDRKRYLPFKKNICL